MDIKKIIDEVKSFEDLKIAKSIIFKKDGPLFELTTKLKTTNSSSEKAEIGKQITNLKQEIDFLINQKNIELENSKINKLILEDKNDIFNFQTKFDYIHPLDEISNLFRDWFFHNGYYEKNASEIESDEYNFQKLNIPPNHPSRDMQDTLYISTTKLLRTHNTGITARLLKENKNKCFSAFTIGKVYRNDEDDQTHSHQFTQIDLVSVGDVNISNLIWTLKSLLSYVLEEEINIRLRPSFFPFTEPSMEVDIFFKNKWIEVLGAGTLNEKILNLAGYRKGFRGFAAGIGVERIAMIKYGINDIREFYKNDLKFLKQFKLGKI
ncbi:MAG: phenylalanine--tRNA ligase subunit alpha [Metamycoplasmataceae bacterium]